MAAFRRRRRAQAVLALALIGAAIVGQRRVVSMQDATGDVGQRISSLLSAGSYEEAEAEAERLYRSTAPDDGIGIHDQLVEALTRNGRGAERRTRELAEAIVQIRTGSKPPQSRLLATSIRHLGGVLFESGEYALSAAKFREAIQLNEHAGEAAAPELAAALDALAHALAELVWTEPTSHDEAVRAIDRAVAINQRSATVGTARLLRIRGVLAQGKGDYARARSNLEKARRLQESAYPVHPETALTLVAVGEQLRLDGDLAASHQVLLRACTMTETTLRPGHPHLAECFRSLALTLEELGDLTAARSFCDRGLAIAEAALGADHPRVATQLNDLANISLLQGHFATARTLYERARRAYVARLGAESNGATVATYNLGLLYARLGDHQEARRAFNRATTAWTKALGAGHPSVARALSAVGDVLAEQHQHEQARVYYTRALRIRERELGASHPYVARTLSNLASSLAQLNRSREALALSSRALAIWEQSGGQEGLSETLSIHAQLLIRAGDVTAAELAIRRALNIRIALIGPSHPSVAENEVALSVLELGLGRTAAAFRGALRGERIGREHARLTLGYLSEREATEYITKRPRGLDLALSVADSPSERADVFDELIRGRSLALDEMAARRRIAASVENGDLLWGRLRSTRQRFANLVVRGANAQNPEQYFSLLDEARREKEHAERALAERSTTFRATEHQSVAGIDEVRSALPAGVALVSFVRYAHSPVGTHAPHPGPARGARRPVLSYVAFVLRRGDTAPRVIRLHSAARIDAAVSDWRRLLIAGASIPRETAAGAEASLRIAGAALRRLIWDPIAAHLDGADGVFVVPDAALNLVPLVTLPARAGGYLLEHGPSIHYLSTERDLIGFERRTAAARGGLLAIGGPAFSHAGPFAALRRPAQGAANTLQAGLGATTSRTEIDRRTSAPCATFQSMQFAALPAAAREAGDITARWRASPSSAGATRTLNGSAATEAAFKNLAPGHRVLHLATHGFFLGDWCATPAVDTRAVGGLVATSPRAQRLAPSTAGAELQNPLLMSGLALAGANLRSAAIGEEEDGILTAEEVTSLDLTGVEWAVLSACDTGLGLIRAGEGVFGLRRAFQVAGARTVIMSLWPVEDRTTRSWMLGLYDGRLDRHLDTAAAMRRAALLILRDRRARGLSGHPFFWGGFVAVGDWQ